MKSERIRSQLLLIYAPLFFGAFWLPPILWMVWRKDSPVLDWHIKHAGIIAGLVFLLIILTNFFLWLSIGYWFTALICLPMGLYLLIYTASSLSSALRSEPVNWGPIYRLATTLLGPFASNNNAVE